jgi:hypothetical protein
VKSKEEGEGGEAGQRIGGDRKEENNTDYGRRKSEGSTVSLSPVVSTRPLPLLIGGVADRREGWCRMRKAGWRDGRKDGRQIGRKDGRTEGRGRKKGRCEDRRRLRRKDGEKDRRKEEWRDLFWRSKEGSLFDVFERRAESEISNPTGKGRKKKTDRREARKGTWMRKK